MLDKYKNIEVFVYCGGKCGSSSLTLTLNQYYKTLHVHSDLDFKQFTNQQQISIFDVINYNASTEKKIYIIDSYRTPIERKISSFFQNIKKYLPNYKEYKLRDLIHYFNTKYIYQLEEYHPIHEILTYYKLPLFNTFDFEKKYNLFVYKNINFIKIRFNDIDNWSNILSNIFNRPINMKQDNMSENKHYSQIYNNFKKVYYLPKLYYEVSLPDDTNFKIYNTSNEQQKYYEKWKKRLLPNIK